MVDCSQSNSVLAWKERNARIFSDKFSSFDYFCDVVQFTASNWCDQLKIFCNYSTYTIGLDWRVFVILLQSRDTLVLKSITLFLAFFWAP